MSDERELIENAIRGHKEAFATLVRRYQNRIFGFIMRMTADRENALDLTQDTFLAAYQNLGGFRREALFSTWLFQIAANKTRNFLKKSGREIPLPDDYDVVIDPGRPDSEYQKREQERLLKETIATLPYRQRLAFSLRYYDQMKFDEIARLQGISVSAAKTNFAEALKKLTARLGKK